MANFQTLLTYRTLGVEEEEEEDVPVTKGIMYLVLGIYRKQ